MQPIDEVLAELASDPVLFPSIRAWQRLPPLPPRREPFPGWLAPALAAALRRRGITALYAHQTSAAAAARAGRHTLVVTPTASGKSLCYHLPVLQARLEHPGSTALYLFPTRALARDQAAALGAFWNLACAGPPPVFVYDGDTPAADRPRVRQDAAVVITNPDMLHAALLPYHRLWARFWRRLRHVVIDEAHVYRGLEAAHLANVLRRLRRVCRAYGSDPLFIACSATVGDPAEFARRLLGVEDPALIDRNGAPRGRRDFLVVDPPAGRRDGDLGAAWELARRFLRRGVPTIVFTRSRDQCERLAAALQAAFPRVPGGMAAGAGGRGAGPSPSPVPAVVAYRGGLLPAERRALEAALRDGRALGVVATSALEVGVDIGRLEAAVLCGYPGSVASVWQQAGRAGRSGRPAAAVLVCGGSPVDRYLARHPEALLGAAPEATRFDPDHPAVLEGHLACACAELPLRPAEDFGHGADEALSRLQARGLVRQGPDGWRWIGPGRPSGALRLRADAGPRLTIADATGRSIGDAPLGPTALRLLPGARYLHGGASYRVWSLDPVLSLARVEPSPPEVGEDDRPPGPRPWLQVIPDRLIACRRLPWMEAAWGRALVRASAGGAALERRVDACWAWPPTAAAERLPAPMRPAALRGLGGALRTVAAFHLQCDGRDLALAVQPAAPPHRHPTIVLYERCGGMGLAGAVFRHLERLLAEAERLILSCPCREGCIGCVGAAAGRGTLPGMSPKAATLALLRTTGPGTRPPGPGAGIDPAVCIDGPGRPGPG